MKRIAVIADSLALPRGHDPRSRGPVHFTDTYVEKLAANLRRDVALGSSVVLPMARRNRTMADVRDELEEALLLGADFVFVQVGVCDSAPRVLGRRGRALVQRLPGPLRGAVVRAIGANRRTIVSLRGARGLTPIAEFAQHAEAVARRLAATRPGAAAFVNIAPPDAALEHRSPGYRALVDEYNRALASAADRAGVAVIDVFAALAAPGAMEAHSVDGQHYNAAGAELVARLLYDQLRAVARGSAA